MARRSSQLALLKDPLDDLVRTYSVNYLTTDPLWFAHQFQDPRDQEAAAFLASALAYGNVKQIFGTLKKLFGILGKSPFEFIRDYDPAIRPDPFESFYHRLHASKDFRILLHLLAQVYRRDGSLAASFHRHFSPDDLDVAPALSRWTDEMLSLSVKPFYESGSLPSRAPVRFFFSSPAAGSSCKRLNLFLRWMVRGPDGIDFGLWSFIAPRQLVIPLDTHIFRVAKRLRLTRRRTANWKTAREITDRLKIFDAEDPVKYDFALTRPGILKLALPEQLDRRHGKGFPQKGAKILRAGAVC